MCVGRIFSREGAIVDFSRGSQKDFSRGGKKIFPGVAKSGEILFVPL